MEPLWFLFQGMLSLDRNTACPPLCHPVRTGQHPPFSCDRKCVLCSLVGYSKSWEVCSQLGQSEGYQDLGMRQELMAFALTHCPPCAIEALLAVSSSLQTQVPATGVSLMKVQCLPKWRTLGLIFKLVPLSSTLQYIYLYLFCSALLFSVIFLFCFHCYISANEVSF